MNKRIKRFLKLILTLNLTSNLTFASCPTANETEKVYSCRRNFIENNCDIFVGSSLEKNIIHCTVEEARKDNAQKIENNLDACGDGVSEDAKQLYKYLSNTTVEGLRKERDAAYHSDDALTQECAKELDPTGKTTIDQYRRKHPFGEAYCVTKRKVTRTSQAVNAAWDNATKEKIIAGFILAKKTSQCFKSEKFSQIICPFIASVIATQGSALLFKSGLKYAGRGFDPEISEYIALLSQHADSEKEKLSVAHQKDLINLSEVLKNTTQKLNIDLKSMQQGILDSDMGKLNYFWENRFLQKSAKSDELIGMLQGKQDTAAGRAFANVLKDAGFSSASFLNPNLSADQVREVFKNSPTLRGYLHEMPGFSTAIADLNASRITNDDFKKRVAANLFHNGPNEGFWKMFGEVFVPGSLGNGDENAKNIFRSTLFQTPKKDDNGVIAPKYPGPISAEGAMHTFMDRMSQGTQGGIIKIYTELGNNPANAFEMLIENPKSTLKQLDTLKTHVKEMRLSSNQKKELTQLITVGERRMKIQNEFLEARIKKDGIGNGFTVHLSSGETYHIGPDSDPTEAKAWMLKLRDEEQLKNGDPMADFPFKKNDVRKIFFPIASCGNSNIIEAGTEDQTAPDSTGSK